MLKLDHISQSSLSMYRRCPRNFWLRYSGQSVIRPAARLADNIGRRWHEWQEGLAQICKKLDVPMARSEGLELARTYDCPELLALAEAFCDSWRYNWSYRTGAVEQAFRVSLPDGLPDFIGRIDCLELDAYNERLVITDYKTPRIRDYPDQVPFQLKCYAWAAQQAFPNPKTGERFDEIECVRWLVASGEAQTWRLPFGEQTSIRDEIVMLAEEALSAESYPATPSEQACRYCPFKRYCAQARGQRFLAPRNAQAAARLMGKAEVLRAYANDLTALVRDWSQEHGDVMRDGIPYAKCPPDWFQKGFRRYSAKDKEKLFAALQEAKEDPWDFFEADEKALGKRFQTAVEGSEEDPDNPFGEDNPEAVEGVIKQLVETVPGDTWGKRIIEPEEENNGNGQAEGDS